MCAASLPSKGSIVARSREVEIGGACPQNDANAVFPPPRDDVKFREVLSGLDGDFRVLLYCDAGESLDEGDIRPCPRTNGCGDNSETFLRAAPMTVPRLTVSPLLLVPPPTVGEERVLAGTVEWEGERDMLPTELLPTRRLGGETLFGTIIRTLSPPRLLALLNVKPPAIAFTGIVMCCSTCWPFALPSAAPRREWRQGQARLEGNEGVGYALPGQPNDNLHAGIAPTTSYNPFLFLQFISLSSLWRRVSLVCGRAAQLHLPKWVYS